MNNANIEIYKPRQVSSLGLWNVSGLKLKVYGIRADGKEISGAILNAAERFVLKDVPSLVEAEGQSNNLGFVIIHPGELGVSILAHWWIQGSVLCQHIQRTLWESDIPMNTGNRPVIACVWELALINLEQTLWRETMMNDQPNPTAYINTFVTVAEV